VPYRRSRLRNVLPAMAVLAVVGSTSAYAAIAIDSQAPAVTREALAATDDPAGARGKALGLSRVDVPAGAKLALHRHPGTQVAR